MDFMKKVKKDPKKYLKMAGLILLALIFLSFAKEFLGSGRYLTSMPSPDMLRSSQSMAPTMGIANQAYMEESYDGAEAKLSVRNIAPPYEPGTPAGNDAEDFEYTSYSLSYEKNNAESTCERILDLKQRDDVIFSSANNHDQGCYYQFKVENTVKDEILGILEALDPEDLSENTRTIKQQLDDFTSEEEILQAKLQQVDETLNNAISAYDEISALATETRDAESLANIITSKINLIERLTEEKIRINEQLDRLSRSKTDQLDKLDYTSFSLSVYENKYIDGERLKDSWKMAVQEAVKSLNSIIQAITINLLVLFFLIGQYFIYAILAVFIAKYGWEVMKKIWNK